MMRKVILKFSLLVVGGLLISSGVCFGDEKHLAAGTREVSLERIVATVNGDDLLNLNNVFLVDGKGNTMQKEIYEVKKYRRGRFLIKFSGLKWRNEIEGLRHFAIAI